MKAEKSTDVFRERIERAGLSLGKLTAAESLAQLLAFYREVRADKCVLDAEGDMLIFSWGTHDGDDGETFQLEFARQFIQPGDEDEDGMSQLWLRLHFKMTEALGQIEPGEHECESPADAEAFEEFVLASEAYRAVVALTPSRVEVDWAMM